MQLRSAFLDGRDRHDLRRRGFPPDPLQLRRVVATFAKLPENTACVQAKLAFHNGTQNLLTAWFTADYALWFSFILLD